jgi:hypothetical protein
LRVAPAAGERIAAGERGCTVTVTIAVNVQESVRLSA